MPRNSLRALLYSFCLVMLSACASSGNPSIADESQASLADKLQEGVTRKGEVSLALGDPLEATFIGDGKEVWTYQYSRSTPLPSNYLPYVSILASGSDEVEHKLTILFDRNDVVEKYTWSESKVENRRGLLAR